MSPASLSLHVPIYSSELRCPTATPFPYARPSRSVRRSWPAMWSPGPPERFPSRLATRATLSRRSTLYSLGKAPGHMPIRNLAVVGFIGCWNSMVSKLNRLVTMDAREIAYRVQEKCRSEAERLRYYAGVDVWPAGGILHNFKHYLVGK